MQLVPLKGCFHLCCVARAYRLEAKTYLCLPATLNLSARKAIRVLFFSPVYPLTHLKLAKGPFKLERFVCPQRTAFTDMSQQRTVNVVADLARFDAEVGRIALGPNATIYVTDRSGHRLLKFPASRPIVAGGGRGFEDSCSDQEDEALFNAPRGIVALSNGNVVVADMYNSAIREVSPSGEVSTLAGGENFGFKNVGIRLLSPSYFHKPVLRGAHPLHTAAMHVRFVRRVWRAVPICGILLVSRSFVPGP